MQIKHIICSTYVFACMLSHFSHVWLFETLWTVACQAPLFMGFSRQEYWCGLPCPPPGELPYPGIKLTSPASPKLQVNYLPTELPGKPKYICIYTHTYIYIYIFLLVVILNGTSCYQILFLTAFSNFLLSYEV